MTEPLARVSAVQEGTTCPLCGFHWPDVTFDLTEHLDRFCPKRGDYEAEMARLNGSED